MNPQNSDPAVLAQPGTPQTTFPPRDNGSPLEAPVLEGSLEELDYDPVPPKKTVTVSVRYRIGGHGQPLPYLL